MKLEELIRIEQDTFAQALTKLAAHLAAHGAQVVELDVKFENASGQLATGVLVFAIEPGRGRRLVKKTPAALH